MHVPKPAAQGQRQPGVEAVVVKDADQIVIQGEGAADEGGHCDGQAGAGGGQRLRHSPAGGKRLNRRMWNSAATPSFQVIFFPSAYVRPL